MCGLLASGFREVILSGVHLGSWGHDLRERLELPDLVGRLLEMTGVERLRLSSLEPWDLSPRFFELLTDDRVLPHLHLPLQSGCDATLRRMARRTSQNEFAGLVEAARSAFPDVSISTDVIVGFPGEDDGEFRTSYEFVEHLAFSRLHVFRYSRRDGTRAATMPDQVPGHVAAARSRHMHELGARLEATSNRASLAAEPRVLWEVRRTSATPSGSGLTRNYVRVTTKTPADEDLMNRIVPTEIVKIIPEDCSAEFSTLDLNAWEAPAKTARVRRRCHFQYCWTHEHPRRKDNSGQQC